MRIRNPSEGRNPDRTFLVRKIIIAPQPNPVLLLLDPDRQGDQKAALLLPGKMPLVFPDLGAAVRALREIAA